MDLPGPRFLLPTRIVLIMPDKKSIQDFRLSNIKPNKEQVDPRYFSAVNPKNNWKVIRNPAPMLLARRTRVRPAQGGCPQAGRAERVGPRRRGPALAPGVAEPQRHVEILRAKPQA